MIELAPIILEADGQIVTVQPRLSKKIKHTRIVIHPKKGVELVINKPSQLAQATNFLISKKQWVINKIAAQNLKSVAEVTLISGNVIPVLGQDYLIVATGDLRGQLRLENNKLLVPGLPEYSSVKVKLFLKQLLKKEIERQLVMLLPRLGVRINRITLKDATTRWGSCGKLGNLSFNWRLVFAPEFILSYVVVHEACHLVQFNHSKEFWSLVKTHYATYKTAISWLKQNGKILHSYQ